MKRIEICVKDCIPTPSSCVTWNGEDIPFLGICTGDCLNFLMNDIVTELQKLTGKENLASFNIDSIINICKDSKKPETVTILSILTLLRNNTICLKTYIDELNTQLSLLLEGTNVKINLKCYIGFDGLGLTITREQLDQLIINVLCEHENSLDSIDSTILRLQEAINEARRNMRAEEVNVATCINEESLPLSIQVQNTTKELCDYELAVGKANDINDALANIPTDLNIEFGGITGWEPAPVNWAQNYGNTILEVENIRQRVAEIENTCCAVTCDDFEIGFTATFNEDGTGVILTFAEGAGMDLPEGFEDCGSKGTITDILGNIQYFDVVVATGTTLEIVLFGMASGNLAVNIASKICNTEKNLICNRCIDAIVEGTACSSPVCKVCVTGDAGTYIDIVYKLDGNYTSTRIAAGQCNYIAKTAEVVGIERVGGATESSDCLDLSEIQEKKCYYLTWAVTDNGNSQTEAWDNHNAIQRITSYSVLGTTYLINSDIYHPEEITAALSNNGLINSILTDLIVINQPIADLFARGFKFKTIPSVAESLFLLVDGSVAGVSRMRITAVEYDCDTDLEIPGS